MRARGLLPLLAALVAAGGALSGCGGSDDPPEVDSVAAPTVGACRRLSPADVERPSNAAATVDCADDHTAETFAVGDLPAELQAADYDAEELGRFAFETCSAQFQKFLGADESTSMRTILSWAWFRPSEKAWDLGARWYRCDVVGGGDDSTAYVALPETATGLLSDRPDDTWMVCVDGPSVEATKVACTEPHSWRAVTTIKVGEPGDAYPGDRVVEVTTRDYCSDSVAAWLGYPPDFDYGYTWFHEGEWAAGNRRSICWAATTA